MSIVACSCGKAHYVPDAGLTDSASDLPADSGEDSARDAPSDMPSDVASEQFDPPITWSKCTTTAADQVETRFPNKSELPRIYESEGADYGHFRCDHRWVLELPAPTIAVNVHPVFQRGDQPPADCGKLRASMMVWTANCSDLIGACNWNLVGSLTVRGELDTIGGVSYCRHEPENGKSSKVWLVPDYDKIRIGASAQLDGESTGSQPVSVEFHHE